MEFKLADHETRMQLDEAIRVAIVSMTDLEKKDCAILGTHEDLERFALSPTTTVHGVPCKATDVKKSKIVPEKGNKKASKRVTNKKSKK